MALAARSESELLVLEEKLLKDGIAHKAIREPDPPWNGALMAIGIVPQDRDKLRRYLSTLPLVK